MKILIIKIPFFYAYSSYFAGIRDQLIIGQSLRQYQIKNTTIMNNSEHYGTKLVPVMAYSAHNAGKSRDRSCHRE